jgi:hypothetical protein
MVETSLGIKVRPYLKNNKSKMDWWHGSSDRVPAWEVRDTGSNPSTTKNKSFGS